VNVVTLTNHAISGRKYKLDINLKKQFYNFSAENISYIEKIENFENFLSFNRQRKLNHNLTHYRSAMPFGNRKVYFRGSFHFSIVIFKKKYLPSRNLKFNN